MDRKEQLKFFCMVISMATLIEYSLGMFTLSSWTSSRANMSKPSQQLNLAQNVMDQDGTSGSEMAELGKHTSGTKMAELSSESKMAEVNSEPKMVESTMGQNMAKPSSGGKNPGQSGRNSLKHKPGLNSAEVFELFSNM